MMKHICIGIPVHTEPKRLLATLDCLRRHTEQDVDLLLLPDGPDDETKATLDALHDLAQAGTAKSLGSPACFNRLANSTSADIVVLLESGALVGPHWLEYLLAALNANPLNGLAGPSTNRAWNQQHISPGSNSTPTEISRIAQQVAQRFGATTRTLEPLYSLSDFCYVVRREVIQTIGAADEGYGLGPCWEMDYNIRATRAGFHGVWACGAYVWRAPFTARRQREEAARFTASKQLYQDRFCGLRLQGKKTDYEPHCRGEACEYFAPPELIQVTLRQPQQQEKAGHKQLQPPAEKTTPIHPSHTSTVLDAPTAPADDLPLISCIMPTRNRRVFVQQAIAYFERQDYPNRELIIVDDGNDPIADLVSSNPRVRYLSLPTQTSIGAKRNLACEMAHGTIIAHWDDDWYAAHRLRHQVVPLLAKTSDITGLETSCFFDLPHWQTWTCTPALHSRLFVSDVHGGTLVYWRKVWEQMARYPSASLAEDAFFLRSALRRGARLQKLPHANSFVYLRHDNNAWSFPLGSYLDPRGWQQADLHDYLPAADLPFYAALSPAAPALTRSVEQGSPSLQMNLEKKDCELSPLVTCIMPTYNRRQYVPQAIQYFLRQDYPNRELLILDDGSEPVDELVPSDPRIRYIRLDKRMILGAKRNLACKLAQGSIIAHWDDDDWIAPHRLRYQVEVLEREKADLCGAGRQLYYDPSTERAWLYEYPPTLRRWLAGNTLCYRKVFWESNPFPAIAIGEDTRFIWGPRAQKAAVVPDHTFYVGLVHPANTSRKVVSGSYWHPHPVAEIHRLLGSDLAFYLPVGVSAVAPASLPG